MGKYKGPFKKIYEAEAYINNPANGSLLDLFADDPLLYNIYTTFNAKQVLTSTKEVKKTESTDLSDKIKKSLAIFEILYT